jgi:hypothetical protein
MLKYASEWNTNTKFYYIAQVVIEVILKNYGPEFFLDESNKEFTQKFVEDTLPYTERHAARIDKLCQNVMFIDFAWQNIKLDMNEQEGMDEENGEKDDKTEFEKLLERMKIEDEKQKLKA